MAIAKQPTVANPPPIDGLRQNGRAFCMAPWRNLSIAIGGVATPCCEFQGDCGNVKKQSVSDIWHGQAFRDFRAKMLRDERDDRCWKCYEVEETGGLSMRNRFNARPVRHACGPGSDTGAGAAESLTPPLPIQLDIRFSNLCNFTCRTCGPPASSKWFTEGRKMGWTASEALTTTYSSTEAGMRALRPLLATIEEIYFAGGEPLLIEQHYAVLEELIKQGRTDVSLAYNTNMSELRLGRRDVLALWSRFKNVYVGASIDGAGARGELIREGLSWTNFVANVSAVKQRCPHVRMVFCVTVSVFNVWALPELCRDLLTLEGTGVRNIQFGFVQEPKHYSIQILPGAIKREVRRRLQDAWHTMPGGAGAIDCSIQDEFRHIIDYMMADNRTDLIEIFRSNTLRLDAMRNKSTAAICPELAPLLRHGAFPMLYHCVRFVSRRAVRFNKWLTQASHNVLRSFATRVHQE